MNGDVGVLDGDRSAHVALERTGDRDAVAVEIDEAAAGISTARPRDEAR